MIMDHWRNDTDGGSWSTRRKNCLRNPLPTTNFTYSGQESNMDHRVEGPVTNRLSYDTGLEVWVHANST